MEYWIFIVITLVAVFLICLVVFAIRCTEFNHVMRKMRSLSTSSGHVTAAASSSPTAAAAASQRWGGHAHQSSPPPYRESLHHPIIAQSSAQPTGRRDAGSLRPPIEAPEVSYTIPSGPLPVDAYFIPPPYCLEPPAYCDVIAECPGCDDRSASAIEATEL